jgi:hypothetical protein
MKYNKLQNLTSRNQKNNIHHRGTEIAEEIFFLTFPEKGESQKTPALRAVLRLQN